ncbi:hypothetical protein V6N13_096287 [Hibiscus sabdariffa]
MHAEAGPSLRRALLSAWSNLELREIVAKRITFEICQGQGIARNKCFTASENHDIPYADGDGILLGF